LVPPIILGEKFLKAKGNFPLGNSSKFPRLRNWRIEGNWGIGPYLGLSSLIGKFLFSKGKTKKEGFWDWGGQLEAFKKEEALLNL